MGGPSETLRKLFSRDQAGDIVEGLDMLKADTEKRATRRKWRPSELAMVLGGLDMTRAKFLQAWPELNLPAQADIEQTTTPAAGPATPVKPAATAAGANPADKK